MKWWLIGFLLLPLSARAQNRGVYPLGMSALNSGVTAQPGFTYANQLLFYSRDQAKDEHGQTLPVKGDNDVLMDLNTLSWVRDAEIFWHARYSAAVTVPVAKNSLSSELRGPISGGRGLADCYFMPLILSWNGDFFSVRGTYGVLAPTGKFTAGANDNVGSGYWTHTLSSGQSFYFSEKRSWVLSLFELYEFHTEQAGTGIHPGQTFNLDASVLARVSEAENLQVHAGVVGYLQRQTTAKTGSELTSEEMSARYAVNAFGAAVSFVFPSILANLSFRYFKEFANRATYEGDSLQMGGAIAF